jgi:nucleotide-binding universal stress UspA family protein
MSSTTLLVATDLLPKTDAAVARAARLATSLRADCTLLHAFSTDARDGAVSKRTRESVIRLSAIAAQEGWPERQPINVLARAGAASTVIIEAATELHADLLVLGPHANRGASERVATALGGTVAERALATRTCPVLIVREQPQGAYRRILVALDQSRAALQAIRTAEALVMTPEADVSVLHSVAAPYFDTVEYLGAPQGTSAQALEAFRTRATVGVRALLRQASADISRYGIQIADRPPARAIIDAMDQQEPDLLVLGTSGRGPWGRALIGSVASEVMRNAWCDVLVVPELAQQPALPGEENVSRRIEAESMQARRRWL